MKERKKRREGGEKEEARFVRLYPFSFSRQKQPGFC